MKVYVITIGIYSEYHIVGVSIDKNEADKIATMVYGNVETYDSDVFSTVSKDTEAYYVRGEINGELFARKDSNLFNVDKYMNGVIDEAVDGRCFFKCNCFAKDKEHALKIAYDLRAKLLAERIGL